MKATKSFMFINKNPKSNSLSHSHKKERVQIHSHVQKGRRYKKYDGGIDQAIQLPLLQPVGRQHLTTEEGQQCRSRIETLPLQSPHAASVVHYDPELGEYEHDGLHVQEQDPNIDPCLWSQSQTREDEPCSLASVPVFPAMDGDSFDPFDATCVKVDGAMHSLLQYFLRVLHPNIWHLERAVRADHAYSFRSDAMTIMQGCLHDQYNMFALLSYMSSYMNDIEGIEPPGEGALYMHKALRASQDYVKSGQPITGRLIWNTFAMGCAEWYRYNRAGALVHLKAAKSMADALGGLQVLDRALQELLLTGDSYAAAEMRHKPVWSDADFDNGDGHPMTAYGLQELQKILSGSVPFASGLLVSSQRKIIPPALRWVILDLAVVLSVLRNTCGTTSDNETPPDGLHWVHRRSIAIRHRLLHMELEDGRSDVVRTAIVIWMFMCFTITGRKRSIKVIAPFLKEAMLAIDDDSWAGHDEIKVWTLIIGTLSAAAGSKDHAWFVSELNASYVMRANTAERLLATMNVISDKFFYHEYAQKNELVALAEHLQHLRIKKRRKPRSTIASKTPE